MTIYVYCSDFEQSCLWLQVDGETVVRPYTPVTLDLDHGHFDLVVKIYFATDKKPVRLQQNTIENFQAFVLPKPRCSKQSVEEAAGDCACKCVQFVVLTSLILDTLD